VDASPARRVSAPVMLGSAWVKDAGFKTKREFELTDSEPPTRIRWTEKSRNLIIVPQGGYDLTPDGDGTQLTFFNELEGHGLGKLLAGFALASLASAPTPLPGRLSTRLRQAREPRGRGAFPFAEG
jgi:hypothetical protein